jgi:hypothetical protein
MAPDNIASEHEPLSESKCEKRSEHYNVPCAILNGARRLRVRALTCGASKNMQQGLVPLSAQRRSLWCASFASPRGTRASQSRPTSLTCTGSCAKVPAHIISGTAVTSRCRRNPLRQNRSAWNLPMVQITNFSNSHTCTLEGDDRWDQPL